VPREYAEVRVLPSGHVEVPIGSVSQGQGHETVFAQVVAERLGVPFETVRLVMGDTDRVADGVRTFASRSMARGGSPAVEASDLRVAAVAWTMVDDSGRSVNPMIVHGQMHGAVAQGIGQALTERCVYDRASGQLVSGSFLDYAIPRADDLPAISVTSRDVPSPTNPLGVKGAGEGGAVGAPGAVIHPILDALAPLGVPHIDMPATPARVWQAIQDARANA